LQGLEAIESFGKLLRNCVKPEIGKHILDCALKQKQTNLINVLEEKKHE
jgi:hypothetical protein